MAEIDTKGQDAASKRLDQVECAVCRIEGIEAGSPGCNGCRVGMMARYLREVLAEKFHLDFAANRWIGQCGHSWQREDDAPPLCPYCAINNERRALLDRIEELERRDVYDAERAQTWNAAVGLRGAIRVALDEWHNIADHSEAAHAVHDILSNAYQDTAGKIA